MPTTSRSLVGRHDEITTLRALVRAAEQGEGGVLVLRGEPGIGKSALLDHIGHTTPERFQVIRASGAEFEDELPFAALHQLCVPVLAHLDTLSAPYRDSLLIAFGLADGTPDPFRVGLAALELLAAAAAQRPMLCVVDDAHWLDAASVRALTFLARRIAVEPIAMVFAARDQDVSGLDELPRLTVGGLSDAHARALLAEEKTVTLDERVRDRLLAEARGNPLALIELPKAGGFAPPAPSPVASRIERSFQSRTAELPSDARLLLILASADPTGDPGLLWAAARRLGIDVPAASAAAEASGLARFDTRAVLPSTGTLGRLPCGRAGAAPCGTSGTGRRHRPGRRPGPARLAPCAGHHRAGRTGRGGTGVLGVAGTGAWGRRGRRRVPRTRGRAVTRSRQTDRAHARGRAGDARGGRGGRGGGPAGQHRHRETG